MLARIIRRRSIVAAHTRDFTASAVRPAFGLKGKKSPRPSNDARDRDDEYDPEWKRSQEMKRAGISFGLKPKTAQSIARESSGSRSGFQAKTKVAEVAETAEESGAHGLWGSRPEEERTAQWVLDARRAAPTHTADPPVKPFQRDTQLPHHGVDLTDTMSPREHQTVLYLSNLSFQSTDAELVRWFAPLAKAKAIKIGSVNGTHAGWAHIQFENHEEATRVMEAQKEEPFYINQRRVYAVWSTRDNIPTTVVEGMLVIHRLPPAVREEDVRKALEAVEPVESLVLRPTADGQHVYAYAGFLAHDQMLKVFKAHQQTPLSFGGDTSAILVPLCTDQKSTEAQVRADYPEPSRVLFFGNLAFDTDEMELQAVIERTFRVRSMQMGHRQDGRPAGYAHVEFASVEEALSVMQAHALMPFECMGRRLNLAWRAATGRAFERRNSPPSDTLFVGNLPFNCTEYDLERRLLEFCAPTSVSSPSQSSGCAFARFGSIEDAQAAQQAIQDKHLMIGGRKPNVDFAKGTRGDTPRNPRSAKILLVREYPGTKADLMSALHRYAVEDIIFQRSTPEWQPASEHSKRDAYVYFRERRDAQSAWSMLSDTLAVEWPKNWPRLPVAGPINGRAAREGRGPERARGAAGYGLRTEETEA